VLHEATDRRVFFKSATVVIPSSWRDGKCQTVIREPNSDTPYRTPDIRIDSHKHPLYGEAPYTQQSRGCGQPGDVTVFPAKFVTAWNDTWRLWGDPAKLFVHEWAKLRYGVFDERGYQGDPLFPDFYTLPDGSIRPTGSSNERINGRWMDKDQKSECDPRKVSEGEYCMFFPAGNNSKVTCSLGYLYYLPSVKTFCNRLTQPGMPPMGPTKHNIICEGKSSGEVIESHDDFSSNRYCKIIQFIDIRGHSNM
jgi:calcium-activated chloride channel regulator 4